MGTSTVTLDPATERAVRNHVGTAQPGDLIARPRESWRPGAIGVVRAFGAWRFGVIVKVTPTRATVAYITPSNPRLIRFATTADVRIGRFWTPGADAIPAPADDLAVVVDTDTGEILTRPMSRAEADRVVALTTERHVHVDATRYTGSETPTVGAMASHKTRDLDPRPVVRVSGDGLAIWLDFSGRTFGPYPASNYRYTTVEAVSV